MHPAWSDFLRSQGIGSDATAAERVAADLQAARSGCIIGALGHYSFIEVSGADAETFLHGQLSSDVRGLPPHGCQLSSYNSPKGRVLASLLLWRHADGFLLQAPQATAPDLCKRLTLYVLRSKVRLSVVDERFVGIGIGGPRAVEVLTAAGLVVPKPFHIDSNAQRPAGEAGPCVVLALPGSRFQLLCAEVSGAILLWERLRARGAVAAASAAWQWLTIHSGIAEIVAQTQDRYVAQMLNYDLLGAVSFSQGCYPGQEIVARMQYRGGTKRRTLLFHAETAHAPLPAQAIHGETDQAVGDVLAVAPAPDGGYDLLDCLHLDLAAGSGLRLDAPERPVLRRLALPYQIPEMV
jgi:folate-binding protein YgfZ